MYYLNSRYYNPEWGRFINADATCGEIGDLLSHNAFCYCKNNPVNMSDQSGHWPKWLDTAISSIKSTTKAVYNAITSTVASIAIKIYDAIKGTNFGEIQGAIGISGFIDKSSNDAKNVIKDKKTHAENVVSIGTQGSKGKVKPFINKKLMPDEKKYISHCESTYSDMVTYESFQLNRDINGLSWNQLTNNEQDTIAQNITIWDKPMTNNFMKSYGADALKEGIGIVYGP